MKCTWILKRKKVKTTITNLLNELGICSIDVVKYNKQTGWITYLDLKYV